MLEICVVFVVIVLLCLERVGGKVQALVYDTLPSRGRCRKAMLGVWVGGWGKWRGRGRGHFSIKTVSVLGSCFASVIGLPVILVCYFFSAWVCYAIYVIALVWTEMVWVFCVGILSAGLNLMSCAIFTCWKKSILIFSSAACKQLTTSMGPVINHPAASRYNGGLWNRRHGE